MRGGRPSRVVRPLRRDAPLARLPDPHQHGGILDTREVSRILAEIDATDDAAHDLRRARLRQRVHEADLLGAHRLAQTSTTCGEPPRRASDSTTPRWSTTKQTTPSPLSSSGTPMAAASRDGRVRDERAPRPRPGPTRLPATLIVSSAAPVQEPEAVLVDVRPVAVVPDAGPKRAEVGLEVALAVVQEALRHARARAACRRGARCRPRTGWPSSSKTSTSMPRPGPPSVVGLSGVMGSGERRQPDDLGAARDVDDRAALPPPTCSKNHVVRVGVPGLAGGAEDAQRREVVAGRRARRLRASAGGSRWARCRGA